MIDPKCNRADCELQGLWIPVYVIKPLGARDTKQALRGQLGMVVCDEHKAEIPDVDALLGAEGWLQIRAGIMGANMVEPDPDVLLEWRKLGLCNRVDAVTNVPCDRFVAAELMLAYHEDDGKTHTLSITCCREHADDIQREIMEGILHPDVCDRISFGQAGA